MDAESRRWRFGACSRRPMHNSETILPNDDPNSASKCTKNGVFGNYDPPQIKLAQKWCWLQWNAATECNNNMLPLAAFPKNY
jgi:hypothetical protein